MKRDKKERLLACTTLDELLDVEYGVKGTPTREKFDEETREFRSKKDDTLMTKEEFFAKIDRAKEQARQGLGYSKNPEETWEEFFHRMKAEGHV